MLSFVLLVVFLTTLGTLVMMKSWLRLTCIMLRPGRSAANGQLVIPGCVVEIRWTKASPLVPGKLSRLMLVSSPSLSWSACLLLG